MYCENCKQERPMHHGDCAICGAIFEPKERQMTSEEKKAVREALAALNVMVACREQHTERSMSAVNKALAILDKSDGVEKAVRAVIEAEASCHAKDLCLMGYDAEQESIAKIELERKTCEKCRYLEDIKHPVSRHCSAHYVKIEKSKENREWAEIEERNKRRRKLSDAIQALAKEAGNG